MPVFASTVQELLIFFVVALIAAILARQERRILIVLVAVYALSLAGGFSAAHTITFPILSRTAEVVSILLRGIAWINLGAIIIFSILLRPMRLAPPRIIRDLALAFTYIAFVFFLFSHYRVDVTGVIATSAVVTAVVGFSLQDILSNVMAGIALQFDRSVKPGDWIKYGDTSGIVREISWRRVSVETRNGDLIIVPNNLLMKNQVTVQGRLWNGEHRERRWVYFDVDARFSPSQVIEVVTEALNREQIAHVARTPEPHVVLMALENGWGHYAARYWLLDLAVDDPTDSAIRSRLWYALDRAGIPLAIPRSSIALHRSEELVPIHPPTSDGRLRALRSVSIFASLTPEELEQIAANLIYSRFAPGEAIIMQGHAVHHLYILTRGRVQVRVSVDGGASSAVAQMEAPNFFGEGGMLTGAPRSATIIALTEAECWRLDKQGFEAVIRKRPQIAQEVSKVLAERSVALAAVREGLSEETRRQRLSAEHQSMLERIERFFGL